MVTFWCSVQHDCMDRIDRGRNTLSFVKDVIIRFLNETFVLDKALEFHFIIN
jgi:hypothetical protein